MCNLADSQTYGLISVYSHIASLFIYVDILQIPVVLSVS